MKTFRTAQKPKSKKKEDTKVDISKIPPPRSRHEMLNATNPLLKNLVKIHTDIEWPNLSEYKHNINEFWAVLFKQLTEPYMTREQKVKIYDKIKRRVFEEQSNQIKQAKLEDRQKSARNASSTISTDAHLNAYNLDNEELNYVVFKKYLLKMYKLNDMPLKKPKKSIKIKRSMTQRRRSSVLASAQLFNRLADPKVGKPMKKPKVSMISDHHSYVRKSHGTSSCLSIRSP